MYLEGVTNKSNGGDGRGIRKMIDNGKDLKDNKFIELEETHQHNK